jgi:peptide/nickel transport system substrate-binding protein
LVLALALNASASTTSRTLATPFSFNPGSLDPDIFYGNEGLEVTTSCYEGLLRYKDNTTEIVPDLATSYTVSKNGKTYTFQLRRNVRFSDGTPFNSSAMAYDLMRRLAVNGGPAYMVKPIASTNTSNPNVLVIHLKTPENPFPSWLASPYGPKAVSPTVIKAHLGSNHAQTWLANHCAGTGPYTLAKAVPGQTYQLQANPDYWGSKPYFTTINIPVIPSFSTQELELRAGQLAVMTHGIPLAELKSFTANPQFQVAVLPGISAMNLWINIHKPNLQKLAVRKAISMALNRQLLDKEVYGNTATVYNGLFAPGTLPDKYGYHIAYAPAKARSIVAKVPTSQRSINLVYTTDNASNQQLAGLMSQELDSVGFNVTLRGLPETEVFNFGTEPNSQRPDMIVLPQNPDDASPSSAAQIDWLSPAGAGAFFPPLSPAADNVLERATMSTAPSQATALYGKASEMYAALDAYVPIADNETVIVARKGLTGFGVQRQGLWTADLATLRAG